MDTNGHKWTPMDTNVSIRPWCEAVSKDIVVSDIRLEAKSG